MVPEEEQKLQFDCFDRKCARTGRPMNCHSVVVSSPVSDSLDPNGTSLFEFEYETIRISWTMKTLSDSTMEETGWVSQDHFSMLEDGSITKSGTDFMVQLIIHLQAKWLELCNQVDMHLRYCVSPLHHDHFFGVLPSIGS
jgi:hypothetical protein